MNRAFIDTAIKGNIKVRINFFHYIDATFGGTPTLIKCKVTYRKTKKVVKGCAQLFPSLGEAEAFITKLQRVRSKFVLKPLFAIEYDGTGIAIMERVRSLNPWVKRTDKGLWKHITTPTKKITVFGPNLVGLLEGVMEGLKDLHHANIPQGNLLENIYMGKDGRVTLNIMAEQSLTASAENMKKDFRAVKDLVKNLKNHDPPKYSCVQLRWFKKFFKFEKYRLLHNNSDDQYEVNFKSIASLIYRIPCLWNPVAAALLFIVVDEMNNPSPNTVATDPARVHIHGTFKIARHFPSNWGNSLGLVQLNKIYHGPGKNVNQLYTSAEGVIHFARDVIHHALYCLEDAVFYLQTQWPEISLVFFLEVLRSQELDSVIRIEGQGNMKFYRYLGCSIFTGIETSDKDLRIEEMDPRVMTN